MPYSAMESGPVPCDVSKKKTKFEEVEMAKPGRKPLPPGEKVVDARVLLKEKDMEVLKQRAFDANLSLGHYFKQCSDVASRDWP